MPKRIYVAGPYSKPDPVINTRNAVLVAKRLVAAGLLPFVPHLSHVWHLVSPQPYRYWLEYDLHWLRVCDGVLRLPGDSPGADEECAEARRLGLPVYDDLETLLKLEACNAKTS